MAKIDDFPSNAKHPVRQEAAAPVEDKKIERVVTGTVVRRKKSWFSKTKETIMGGDSRSVVSFMVEDVMLPALRDTVVEAFAGGLERAVYGTDSGRSRRPSRGSTSYTPYNRYSAPSARRDEPRRETPSRRRPSFQIDDVVLPNKVDAEEVLDRMVYYTDKYERASVADLNELLGESSGHTDNKYGWVKGELDGVRIRRVSGGWAVSFPDPDVLD